MRKLTMKRKSKNIETNSTEAESNDSRYESDDENYEANDNKSYSEKENSKSSPRKSSKKKTKKSRKSAAADETNGTQEDNYEVEAVLKEKTIDGEKHYLIRWKGYGAESDTWEPAATVNCPELIAEYEKKKPTTSVSPNKKNSKRSSSKQADSKSERKSSSPKKRARTGRDDDDGDDEGEYEVDKIVEVYFKKNGKREFLVHWKGYTANENTWEPEENMSCPELIERFMSKVNRARESDSRELRVHRKPTEHFTLNMVGSGRRLSRRNAGKQRAQYKETD